MDTSKQHIKIRDPGYAAEIVDILKEFLNDKKFSTALASDAPLLNNITTQLLENSPDKVEVLFGIAHVAYTFGFYRSQQEERLASLDSRRL